ncbi:L-aspartate oxidase [Calycomorphotria hydatis]|uniref:L-aspartate oxidase n=1 Tax=Calycomorphotria hydatis TaxID=2528027 RepID=A0A517T4V8_9PLAN|nr:L-aspartate oxidase [Calycomorphotria hydatis]QDT63405.1 L-aspartate oxidase [Calycomorphotria hydatis]
MNISLPLSRRYLVRFNPKRVPHMYADVLILGGGIAGMRAALAIDPSLETVVITKDTVVESNSSYAQGGIAGVLDPLDEFAHHVDDTVAAGKGLCDLDVVTSVIEEAPARIRELIAYGAKFDEVDGEIALTREGGHSHRRIAHALGDATGWEVMRAVRHEVRSRDSIQCWEKTFLLDLLTHDGRCCGALLWNPEHGKTFVWAKSTILCTGGAGRIYRETTNPDIATADGHAAAFRAGAQLRDMEFMQFHPTVLYIAGSSRHLISEAVRGEGAYLRNIRGERFMENYSPQLELAPRDEVSRAITSEMARTNHPCVYLDLTHLDTALVHERFPNIGKVCAEFNLDITQDFIPVRPGAHYMIGGITVDEVGTSSLPGLWAAGEATSSGLHGANRLASNSLLEGLVYGLRCGQAASEHALATPDAFTMPPLVANWPSPKHEDEEDLDLDDVRNSLMSLMWRNCGIRRDGDSLNDAAAQVGFWDRYVSAREFKRPRGWELQNMLLVSRLMIAAAIAREESRGVHFRSDFPEPHEPAIPHISIASE